MQCLQRFYYQLSSAGDQHVGLIFQIFGLSCSPQVMVLSFQASTQCTQNVETTLINIIPVFLINIGSVWFQHSTEC